MTHSSRRLVFLSCFALFLALSLLTPVTPFLSAYSPEPQQNRALQELWIDVSIGPPIVPIFNAAAREDDIARVEHPSQIGQLDGIENGRKMVIFKSIAETEEQLPDMADGIDIIGYNLEHGLATPDAEQQDPLGSIKKMRALADAYDLQLAFGPDHDFALSHGAEVAPFVDIFVLQIQRQQTNPRTVAAFVEPIVPQLREANPDLAISVQIRTEGDVEAILDLVDSLEVELDGISILTSPETVAVAEEMVTTLRPKPSILSPGFGGSSTIIVAAVLAVLLLVGVFIYRRRQAA